MQTIRTEDPAFVRDVNNMAILNTNNVALEQYKQQRSQLSVMNHTISEVATLRQDIDEIKTLLRQIISGSI